MKNLFHQGKYIFFFLKKNLISRDQSYQQVNNYSLPDGKLVDIGEDKTMILEKLFNPVN